jgi:hypothetical protein
MWYGIEIYLLIGMCFTALSLSLMGNPWTGSKAAFVIATILAVAAWPGFVLVVVWSLYTVYSGARNANKP